MIKGIRMSSEAVRSDVTTDVTTYDEIPEAHTYKDADADADTDVANVANETFQMQLQKVSNAFKNVSREEFNSTGLHVVLDSPPTQQLCELLSERGYDYSTGSQSTVVRKNRKTHSKSYHYVDIYLPGSVSKAKSSYRRYDDEFQRLADRFNDFWNPRFFRFPSLLG